GPDRGQTGCGRRQFSISHHQFDDQLGINEYPRYQDGVRADSAGCADGRNGRTEVEYGRTAARHSRTARERTRTETWRGRTATRMNRTRIQNSRTPSGIGRTATRNSRKATWNRRTERKSVCVATILQVFSRSQPFRRAGYPSAKR